MKKVKQKILRVQPENLIQLGWEKGNVLVVVYKEKKK